MSEPVIVGDLVTPENVASLPVGTIVRWTWADGRRCAALVGIVWHLTGGTQWTMDSARAFVALGTAFIAYLPEGT